jgi:hypothetical protein
MRILFEWAGHVRCFVVGFAREVCVSVPGGAIEAPYPFETQFLTTSLRRNAAAISSRV